MSLSSNCIAVLPAAISPGRGRSDLVRGGLSRPGRTSLRLIRRHSTGAERRSGDGKAIARQLVRQILFRASVTLAGEVCSTLRWREPDSIGPAQKETAVERGPAADHRRLERRPALNDPIKLIGPAALVGNSRETFNTSGTDGSNPAPSSGESTNHRFLGGRSRICCGVSLSCCACGVRGTATDKN